MNLTHRQMKIFVMTAHSLSFSRSAERLHITQPTLSKLIRDIEEQVGFPLFERTTRRVSLTNDGSAFLPVAMRLVETHELAMSEVAGIARRNHETISVAALPTLAAMMLPQAIARLRAERPQAVVRIHDVLHGTAVALLRDYKVDIALTAFDPFLKDLNFEALFEDSLVFLSLQGCPPPVEARVWSEQKLNELPIIAMPRGSSARYSIDAAFVRENAVFAPAFELSNLASIARFVKAGCGIALIPRLGAELIVDSETVITAIEGAPHRSIGIVTRTNDVLSPLGARIAEEMRLYAKRRA
jgi:LysR family carnitine catabolism transcriptional activator